VLRRVDDRVQSNGGLTGLAVADEQLTLSTADRNHRVDGLDTGRHGLGHRLTVDNSRSDTLDRQRVRRVDRSLVVDRLAESVDHAAYHRLAYRHRHNRARTLNLIAFADLGVIAQNHGAHLA